MVTTRDATNADVDQIIALTRAQRRQLAAWSPVYFNPREGADDAHAGFLAFLVASDDHQTVVLEEADMVRGFFVNVPQENQLWVDDLCFDDPARWPEALSAVVDSSDTPWVTCVSVQDEHRVAALSGANCRTLSTYSALQTEGGGPLTAQDDVSVAADPKLAAPHTFGGRPFSADTPGSLVVTDASEGYVIGSPSVSPPIYDPGGPTCVIDQVVGDDRVGLLTKAIRAATARGDAQVVVVVAEDDPELAGIVASLGFTDEVLLIGT